MQKDDVHYAIGNQMTEEDIETTFMKADFEVGTTNQKNQVRRRGEELRSATRNSFREKRSVRKKPETNNV